MVHLTLHGTPICQLGFTKCQFSTRREAFDHTLHLAPDLAHRTEVTITKGPCPNVQQETRS